MSDTVASLRHKIASAEELESVVRTMKAMAASNIGQYENAVHALDDYYRTVQLGLAACFRQDKTPAADSRVTQKTAASIGVIVFGSDQGLVGQFNEIMVEYAVDTLDKLPGNKIVWAVGARIHARLAETRLQPVAGFTLPNAINNHPQSGWYDESPQRGLLSKSRQFHLLLTFFFPFLVSYILSNHLFI